MSVPAALALLSAVAHASPPPMPHRASYRVRCTDAADADALRQALAVEASDPLGGASVRLRTGDEAEVFHLEIDAVDLAHLRAATNSYLKWLGAAADTLENVQGPGSGGA